jgi:cellulose biosynthesis protein BcsQ
MIISQLIDYLIDIKVKMSLTDKHDFNELRKNLRVLNIDCDECGNVESIVNNSGELKDKFCKHENTEYQPAEPDNNIHESYTCENCGIDLPLPEPDEDTMRGEDR